MAVESSVLQKTAAGEPADRDLQLRIRAEFAEMPGLKLTLPQAARLFSVEEARCKCALIQLVAAGVLGVREGLFVLRERRDAWSQFHGPSARRMERRRHDPRG